MLGVSTRYLPAPPGAFLGTAGFPPAAFATKPLSEQNVVPVSEERTPEGLPEKVMQLAIGLQVTAPGETAVRGVEVTGDPEKIDSLVSLLKGFGIKELVRTGVVAMVRSSGAKEAATPREVPAWA